MGPLALEEISSKGKGAGRSCTDAEAKPWKTLDTAPEHREQEAAGRLRKPALRRNREEILSFLASVHALQTAIN